jgi:hypothetical protein
MLWNASSVDGLLDQGARDGLSDLLSNVPMWWAHTCRAPLLPCCPAPTGLNCGRWDYIFSFIKKLRNHPQFVLPDRWVEEGWGIRIPGDDSIEIRHHGQQLAVMHSKCSM